MLEKSITRVLLCTAWLLACTAGAQAASGPAGLRPDAPDSHVVVRGDTLWDISARFLDSPWRWPEVWQLNREQIANPHLIYPGDVIYLDRSGASPRLRLGRKADTAAAVPAADPSVPSVRLEPSVRVGAVERSPLPTLNAAAIQVFLNRPLVIEPGDLAHSPRIIATQDGRVHLSRGDLAYVRGLPADAPQEWHVYRPARPLVDPDTRRTLAWETLHVGTARLVRAGDPATVRIVSNAEEIGEGDRLMPASRTPIPSAVPRPPDGPIDGRIVSVYRGVDQVGRHSVVALSVGRAQGLEVGHVLAVQRTGRAVTDRETREVLRLPDEPIGQLIVFRVFDRIAYGLVVAAAEPISVGATVTHP